MTETIRCIVCDDEYLGRQNIKQALIYWPHWEIVQELENADQLLNIIEVSRPDIIFLDIRMPGKHGIDVMREIVSVPFPPEIIFVTAFDQYAIEAFELYALDYLLKPFDEQRFAQSIQRAQHAVKLKKLQLGELATTEDRRYLTRIFIPSISKIELVDVSDVYAFVANGNYVNILLEKTKVLHRTSMTHLEKNLDPNLFIRCHRSSIVRVDRIRDLVFLGDEKYQVALSNSARIRMSKTYKDAVMDALKKGAWI